MSEDFNFMMTKLYALCSATDATLFFESKVPPMNAIRNGEKPLMRYTIYNKYGKVLLYKETQTDINAVCELTLHAYEDYVLQNSIKMHILIQDL